MLLDEWGEGQRVAQDQNKEIKSTFQQFDKDNPEYRVRQDLGEKVPTTFQQQRGFEEIGVVEDFLDYPNFDDNDLAKKGTFERFESNAEQADINYNEVETSLEAKSQEENKSGMNKREMLPSGIQADLTKDNHLSREKRARKSRKDRQKNKRKVKKFKQVSMKKGRKGDQAKEKVELRKEIKDLKRQMKKKEKEIENFKNRRRQNKSKKSKGKRIKSGGVRKCRNTDVCIEKWANFSSAVIGPAASIIKQVPELFKF